MDAAVSSRLASASYTAPDNAGIGSIKAKTDNLPANPAAVSDIPAAAAVASQVRTELATELGNLDAKVSTRSPETGGRLQAVETTTNRLATTLEADGPNWRFTTPSLVNAPTGSGVSAQDVADAVRLELAPELAHLDADVSGIPAEIAALLATEHGVGSWVDSSGGGDILFPYTVSDNNGAPVAAARVIVTTDAGGVHRYAMAHSDEFGIARFHLSAGTYYFWTYKPGYQVSVADLEVVP